MSAALNAVPVLGHGCDNPLCQRIGPGHVKPSSPAQNRRAYLARRSLAGNGLGGGLGGWGQHELLDVGGLVPPLDQGGEVAAVPFAGPPPRVAAGSGFPLTHQQRQREHQRLSGGVPASARLAKAAVAW